MYQSIEMCNCKTTVDDNREFLYRYFLLESKKDMLLDEQLISVPSYGIEVVKEEIRYGRVVNIDKDRVEHISTVKNKVISLIEYLRDNEVSPVHLVDIIGENVDEWVSDFDIEARNLLTTIVFA